MVTREYFHDLFGGEASLGSIAEYVILVDDPLIVDSLASEMKNIVVVANHYEFFVRTGYWESVEITICSTGLGGGSASIAIDNLVKLGAKTLIYIGAESNSREVNGLFVAEGAIRHDGTSMDYVRPEFPAISDPEVFLAITAVCENLGISTIPTLMCGSTFPLSQETLASYEIVDTELKYYKDSYKSVLITKPEISTLLTLSTIYRIRGGALYSFNSESHDLGLDIFGVFKIALNSIKCLHNWDQKKKQIGWKIITPDF